MSSGTATAPTPEILQSGRTGRFHRDPRVPAPAVLPPPVPAGRVQLDQLLAAVDAELAKMTRPMAQLLVSAIKRAADPSGAIPGRRLASLSDLVWGVVSGVFGKAPIATIDAKGNPVAPYARLVVAGTRAATELAIQPALEEMTRTLAGRPDLLDALTGGRALPPGGTPKLPIFDTARTWVSPDGYQLSDRIWRVGGDIRTAIDTLLEVEITRGTSAVNIAQTLEQFLSPRGLASKTRTPYGSVGNYPARRLARTEVTRAFGAATVEAARLNPMTAGVRWSVSGSHPKSDECDIRASRDGYGLGAGVYPPRNVPMYPAHPMCKCVLSSVPVKDLNAVIEDLRRWVKGEQVAEFQDVGSVPLESKYLLDYLTGFIALGAT